MKNRLPLLTLAAALAAVAGCKTLDVVSDLGTTVGVATGTITQTQADSIKKTTTAVGKVFDKLSPENEYYIGRSVGATILKSYKPFDSQAANAYLNVLGQTLAMASDRPETFGGYHFLLLDTDEINALAAPGGLVFVSRGLVKCCKDEDALAAVLAHEIGHVQLMHGLKAIETGRFKEAAFTVGIEAGKNLAGDQVGQLASSFEGMLNDIITKLVERGYSPAQEFDADKVAVTILKRVGYNPNGLKELLTEMQSKIKPEKGFGRTHPKPQDRIKAIEPMLQGSDSIVKTPARLARFTKATAGV